MNEIASRGLALIAGILIVLMALVVPGRESVTTVLLLFGIVLIAAGAVGEVSLTLRTAKGSRATVKLDSKTPGRAAKAANKAKGASRDILAKLTK